MLKHILEEKYINHWSKYFSFDEQIKSCLQGDNSLQKNKEEMTKALGSLPFSPNQTTKKESKSSLVTLLPHVFLFLQPKKQSCLSLLLLFPSLRKSLAQILLSCFFYTTRKTKKTGLSSFSPLPLFCSFFLT